MNSRFLLAILSTAALAIPAGAQTQRRAAMVGGGNGVSGRCTGQVIVDGAADLQIQGDTATVRNLSGRPAQIQSFQCTSAIPPQANVRVNVNGRGDARVVALPANGGPAVIHLQDNQGGASPYQFEVTWNNGAYQQGYVNQGYGQQGYDQQRYDQQGYGSDQGYPPPATDREHSERGRNGFGPQQAVGVCQDAIREQAMENLGAQDVHFDSIRMDNNPGRRDWVVGTVDVRRGAQREHYPFSCSVNFDNGRVRTAQIQAPNMGYAGRDFEAGAMDSCRDAVMSRMHDARIDMDQMSMDPDGDLVRGSAWRHGHSYSFSCRMNPQSGRVRDVNISKQ